MSPDQALAELLGRLGANKGAAVLMSEEELASWPNDAVSALKSAGLLSLASPASSVVCPGCEEQCVMPVQTLSGGKRVVSFVVCDKRDDISRVEISAERLRKVRCSIEAVCAFVATSLGLKCSSQRTASGVWELGILKGKKRAQMVCLQANGALELVVGQSRIPLTELVLVAEQGYFVEADVVRRMVDASTAADSRYTPRGDRRETRKLETQALYGAWKKAYRVLRKQRPDMSDVWYSKQIARASTGKVRSAETIRKHMTK